MQCLLFTRKWFQGCLQCVLLQGCPTVVAPLCLPSIQPARTLCLWWAESGACGVSGLVQGCPGLEMSQSRCLPETEQHQTARRFPCVVPSEVLWVGGACSQPTAGVTVGLVSVVIFPSPWSRSQVGVALALVWAARTLPGLEHCFDGILPRAIGGGGSTSLWPLVSVGLWRVCSASFPVAFWVIYANVGVL